MGWRYLNRWATVLSTELYDSGVRIKKRIERPSYEATDIAYACAVPGTGKIALQVCSGSLGQHIGVELEPEEAQHLATVLSNLSRSQRDKGAE